MSVFIDLMINFWPLLLLLFAGVFVASSGMVRKRNILALLNSSSAKKIKQKGGEMEMPSGKGLGKYFAIAIVLVATPPPQTKTSRRGLNGNDKSG